jgi:ribonuclease P protein component
VKSFGLSYRERIKSRSEFEKLFASGKVIFSRDKKIKALYLVQETAEQGIVKIAAVVSSKSGNAFWRNRLKRLIKTSYRLNKESILSSCLLKKLILKIIFSPNRFNEKNNEFVMLEDIMPGIKDILYKIERSL